MIEQSATTLAKLAKLTSLLLTTTALSACGGGFEPFVGVTSGKNFVNEVGKRRYGGGSTCGAAYLPAKWKPGMTARIHWRVLPYPGWKARMLNIPGVNFDQNEKNIIGQYYENHSAVIPLPPPPASMGDDFGQVSNITVHFLACNQLYIDYGTMEDDSRESVKKQFELFAKSQKLCTPRPIIKSMADYRRNKAKLDAIKQERQNIPQVILPEYIRELEQQGKLPVPGK
ncbi:Protein of unknown function [Snodgrassella sp. R-53583]|uniref:DUF3304 domain-containing protein n=1 Tax=Snodgrassella sp. R-53583 TaxID=1798181 RepID=UPI0008159B65|nr:DUF3304 domain-containing protein [Snodgrassella sp. R-53583]SCC13931.1 Protein of unknown function [Snodgrassella sp. R-53583]